NDLQNQVNDLNQQLTLADNAIGTLHQELNQKDGEISRLEDRVKEVETELDNRPRISLDEPARQELENIQRELDREKGWWNKWKSDNITE
ncbi:6105_t:CDS:2, partial [Cetraspora pellucida]